MVDLFYRFTCFLTGYIVGRCIEIDGHLPALPFKRVLASIHCADNRYLLLLLCMVEKFQESFSSAQNHCKCYKKWGGGHSHMLLGINCLSLDPPFYANLTPNDHFFLQSTPNDPFFQFCKEFYIEMKNICVLHAQLKNCIILCQFEQNKIANFDMKILFSPRDFHTLKDPIFWSPHRMTPLF